MAALSASFGALAGEGRAARLLGQPRPRRSATTKARRPPAGSRRPRDGGARRRRRHGRGRRHAVHGVPVVGRPVRARAGRAPARGRARLAGRALGLDLPRATRGSAELERQAPLRRRRSCAELIERHAPDAVLCGHIHEAPFKPDGSWIERRGRTWLFNAGRQIGDVPARIEIDFANHGPLDLARRDRGTIASVVGHVRALRARRDPRGVHRDQIGEHLVHQRRGACRCPRTGA